MGFVLKSVASEVAHQETSFVLWPKREMLQHFDLEAHRSKDVYFLFFVQTECRSGKCGWNLSGVSYEIVLLFEGT